MLVALFSGRFWYMEVFFMSTIAAISTPPGTGGIAVIRISGDKALEVADKVFKPLKRKVLEMNPNSCLYGKIITTDGNALDEGVLTFFKAPHSYTGEDVCEISCHGGGYVSKRVLREILASGAELATAGEFTKRAFLNGKLSLTQAEAVMDVISAEGRQALDSAEKIREGRLFSLISGITAQLKTILAEIGAWVDYPEEDLPEIEPKTLENSLKSAHSALLRIIDNYDSGRVLREGVDTVIVGKANVGKSTLMNSLLGYERSIVTDIEGTTRDVVEETARIGEIVLRLADTAGLRETGDLVESKGIELSKKRLGAAQLVLAVFDSSSPLEEADIELLQLLKDKKTLIILNKSDLGVKVSAGEFLPYSPYVIEISAKYSDGELLEKTLERMFLKETFNPQSDFFVGERQYRCALNAVKALDEAINALAFGVSLDCVGVTLETALESLLELSGENVSETVVEQIFSRFCVGK